MRLSQKTMEKVTGQQSVNYAIFANIKVILATLTLVLSGLKRDNYQINTKRP